MLETAHKGLTLLEVHARILLDHSLSQLFREARVADAENIEPDTVV
jgi:hypothetical protein